MGGGQEKNENRKKEKSNKGTVGSVLSSVFCPSLFAFEGSKGAAFGVSVGDVGGDCFELMTRAEDDEERTRPPASDGVAPMT